jgi:hypothetical protein
MLRIILAAAAASAALLAVVPGAGAKADNRCMPRVSPSSVSFSCWSAYPEAFYTTGITLSTYRVSWKVSCSGRSVAGTSTVRGAVHVIVNQFTQPRAYQLMINSDLCKVSVIARRTAGSGSITMDLFINQNHPAPARN